MSAIQIELPEPVHRRTAQLAQRQSMSLDRLLVVALVEKLATAFPDESMEERARRGRQADFQKFMEGVPAVKPPDYDKLPEDFKPAN